MAAPIAWLFPLRLLSFLPLRMSDYLTQALYVDTFVETLKLIKSEDMRGGISLKLACPGSVTLSQPWSSLVEGGEGLYLPNCQTNLVFALYTLSLLFCKFINTTACHLGRYEPSSPVSCLAPCLS